MSLCNSELTKGTLFQLSKAFSSVWVVMNKDGREISSPFLIPEFRYGACFMHVSIELLLGDYRQRQQTSKNTRYTKKWCSYLTQGVASTILFSAQIYAITCTWGKFD